MTVLGSSCVIRLTRVCVLLLTATQYRWEAPWKPEAPEEGLRKRKRIRRMVLQQTLTKSQISQLSREELEQQLVDVIEAKEEAEQEAAALRDEVSELESAKETSDARAKNFREKVRELQEELEEAKSAMETAKDSDDDESVPALRFEASRLRSELEEARSEARAAEERAGEAEEELEELETRFAALQEELQKERESGGGKARVDDSELKAECAMLRTEVQGLRRALDDERVLHDQQIKDMRSEIRGGRNSSEEGVEGGEETDEEGFGDLGLPLPQSREESTPDQVSESTGVGGDELSVSDGEEEEDEGAQSQGGDEVDRLDSNQAAPGSGVESSGNGTPRYTKEELASQLQSMFDEDSDEEDSPKRKASQATKKPPAPALASGGQKSQKSKPAPQTAAVRKPSASPAPRQTPTQSRPRTSASATRTPPSAAKPPAAKARASPSRERGSPAVKRNAGAGRKSDAGGTVRPTTAPSRARSISPSISRSTEKWIERRQRILQGDEGVRAGATWEDSEFQRRVEEAKRKLTSPRGAPAPNLSRLHPWERAQAFKPASAPGDMPHPTEKLDKKRDEKRHVEAAPLKESDTSNRRIDPTWREQGQPASATITMGSGGLMSTAEQDAKAAVLNIFAKLQSQESDSRVPWVPETLDAPQHRNVQAKPAEPVPWEKLPPPPRATKAVSGGPITVHGAAGTPTSTWGAHQQKNAYSNMRESVPRHLVIVPDDNNKGKRVTGQKNNQCQTSSERLSEGGPRPVKRHFESQRSIQPRPYGVDPSDQHQTASSGLLSTVGLS